VTVDQLRSSPLSGWRPSGGVPMVELPFRSAVNLRADPTGAAADRLADALGARLPAEPNTAAPAGERSLLWLGPDEWLVVGPDGDGPGLVPVLRAALGAERGSAVDVSANRTTIELHGRHARQLLEKGCPIDLHPRAFRAGCCAQTLLARTQVLLWQTGDEPAYRLLVRTSFAAYLAAWLTDAAGS